MDAQEKAALNRALYRRCKATFKHVRVKNPGEKQQRRMSTDLITGKAKPVILHSGEYYAVCCPFCGDTRFRCYINHRYGTDDELGRPQTRLAICFNAGCRLASKEVQAYDELEQLLCGKKLVELRTAHIAEGKEIDVEQIRSTWPGKVTRVDRLDPGHPAVQYLLGRGFDPELIGRFYNVHWCTESSRYLCQERLIIPIYHRKRMVGWQARAAFDTDWKVSHLPKYYTAPGTPRRQILYNLGNASQYRSGIIVEGVTDVWKIGPQAVCTLGAALSGPQQQLFRRSFRDYAGVLLYDPDVKDKVADSVAGFVDKARQEFKNGFCVVQLPDGTDPGSLDRSFLRPYIAQQAEEQGVTISWERR